MLLKRFLLITLMITLTFSGVPLVGLSSEKAHAAENGYEGPRQTVHDPADTLDVAMDSFGISSRATTLFDDTRKFEAWAPEAYLKYQSPSGDLISFSMKGATQNEAPSPAFELYESSDDITYYKVNLESTVLTPSSSATGWYAWREYNANSFMPGTKYIRINFMATSNYFTTGLHDLSFDVKDEESETPNPETPNPETPNPDTPPADYKKLQDLVFFSDTVPGSYTSVPLEKDGSRPPVDTTHMFEGLPSIRFNMTTAPGNWWESQILYSAGWYPFDITRYYENGFLEFNVKGNAGGEKMLISLQGTLSESYLMTKPNPDLANIVTRGSVPIYQADVTGISGVTTQWQRVKIPLKKLIDLNTGFNLQSVNAFVVSHDSSEWPLKQSKFYINNIKITSPDDEASFPAIKVNQVGYKTDSSKVAIVSGFPDELTVPEGTSFEVKRTSDNVTVYTGQLQLQREFDAAFSGERVLLADFTSLTSSGKYYIKVDEPGVVDSVPFQIGNTVYDDLFRDMQRFYYYQRANVDLIEPYAEGFARQAIHTQDHNLRYTSDMSKSRDLSGGWYDAGDFGKYTNNSAIGTSHLLWAYEQFPELFQDNTLNIPESGNGKSDLLDEIKFNLDWYLKAQDYATGGFYAVIAPKNYFDGRMTGDVQGGLNDIKPTTVTADAVAMLAHASTVFKEYDPAYSEQLLQAALRGWQYLLDNPHNILHTEGYPDPSDTDNRVWAAAHIFRATGDPVANAIVLNSYKDYEGIFQDVEYGMGRHLEFDTMLAYVTADQADAEVKSWFADNFSTWKSVLLERQKNNIWRTTLFELGAWWGSNNNIADISMFLALGSMVTNTLDDDVIDAIQNNYNYILGVNPIQTSYFTGYGDNAVKNLFGGVYVNDMRPGVPKGFMVAGVDIYGNKAASKYQFKKFEDSTANYRSTEYAINYMSPAIFSLAVLKQNEGTQKPGALAKDQITLNRVKAQFDLNAPTDIVAYATMLNDKVLTGIKNVTTDTQLTPTLHFQPTTSKAGMIWKTYLQTLPVGTYEFSYQFDNDTSLPLEVEVVANGKVSAAASTFNRNAPQDIAVTVTPYGDTVSGVYNGDTLLEAGTDYIVAGSAYTLKQSYLQTLPVGVSTFTFDFAAGGDQKLNIAVTADLPSGTVSPANATFVKYAPANLSFTVTNNGKTLNAIRYGLTPLVEGTDYTVSGDVYTINASFLQTMRNGYQGLTFDFDSGVDGMVNILVKDNTTAIVTDKTSYQPVAEPTYNPIIDRSVDVLVMFNGNNLNAIKNGETTIAASNYTVAGHFYYLKNSYLKTLPEGPNTITFDFDGGDDVNIPINIVKAVVSPKATTFNKNKPGDITVTMKSTGGTLQSLTNGTNTLVSGTDYVVSGSSYTIKASYLLGLENGSYDFTFNLQNATGITNPVLILQVGEREASLNERLTGATDVAAGLPATVTYGATEVVPASVTGAVYGQSTTISYDPGVLEFVSITPLKDGYSLAEYDNQASQGKLEFAVSQDGAITDDSDLFQIDWRVKAAPSAASVTLTTESEYLDELGRRVDVTPAALTMNVNLVNRTELLDLLTSTQARHDAAVEGTRNGEYGAGSKEALLAAITQATVVYENVGATQEQVTQAIASLNQALETFNQTKVVDNGTGVVVVPNNPVIGNGANSNSQPHQQIITEAELKSKLAAKLVIDLADGKQELLLPAHTVDIIQTRPLIVSSGGADLTIPSQVLAALSGLGTKEELKDSQVKIKLVKMDVTSWIGGGSPLTAAGEGYSLELALVDRKGNEKTLSEFPAAVHVSLPYQGTGVDENLLGVYYRNEQTGAWEYVGGKVNKSSKRMEVDLSHFSTYAVMEWNKTFGDVRADHWVAPALKILAAKHIVAGKTEALFDPNGRTTRAEFVTLISRLLGLKATGNGSVFADVRSSDTYASAVQAAYEAKIINGRSEGRFAPNEAITREEMAVMLMRAYVHATGEAAEGTYSFTDDHQISPWASPAVGAAAKLGVMVGAGGNRFNPKADTTRAETAMVIYKLMNAIATKGQQ
jgi:endoglucanase